MSSFREKKILSISYYKLFKYHSYNSVLLALKVRSGNVRISPFTGEKRW